MATIQSSHHVTSQMEASDFSLKPSLSATLDVTVMEWAAGVDRFTINEDPRSLEIHHTPNELLERRPASRPSPGKRYKLQSSMETPGDYDVVEFELLASPPVRTSRTRSDPCWGNPLGPQEDPVARATGPARAQSAA